MKVGIAANPYIMIDRYFTNLSPIGEQDIMIIIFILYCVKKGISLRFVENILIEEQNNNTLYTRLRNAATGGRQDYRFTGHIIKMYSTISRMNTQLDDKIYIRLLMDIVRRYANLVDSLTFPPIAILSTIAKVLYENKCKSVYLFNDNLCPLSLFLDKDIDIYAHNTREFLNLIRDVIYEAHKQETKILPHYDRPECDAIVSLSGVDYCHSEVVPEYPPIMRGKSNVQEGALNYLIDYNSSNVIIYLLHYRLANNAEYKELRKKLCAQCLIDTVITFPDDTFSDAKVPTSLIILNRKKTDNKVKFVSCGWAPFYLDEVNDENIKEIDIRNNTLSETIIVSYDEMEKTGWSLNAELYSHPEAKCPMDHTLVSLRDLIKYEAKYGSSCPGPNILDMFSCSDSIKDVIDKIKYSTIKRSTRGGYCNINEPAVIFRIDEIDRKIRAAVYDSDEPCSISHTVYTLIPDTDKIIPQYLAYVLMQDASFTRYICKLEEYPSARIAPEYILNRKIAIYTDINKQKQIIKKLKESYQYNVLIASADKNILNTEGEYYALLVKKGIRLAATASTTQDLRDKLYANTTGKISSSEKIDAVIVDTSLPRENQKSSRDNEGFMEVELIRQDYKNIPFYALSDVCSEKLNVADFFIKYYTTEDRRRFFCKSTFESLLDSLVEELKDFNSDDSVLRNKYPDFYEAVNWLDKTRMGGNFGHRITKALKQEMSLTQKEMDDEVNDLRKLAQNIIEWIQEVNLAPQDLTPGEIAIMLRDKNYKDYVYPNQEIMDKGLASLVATLYTIGNEGSHHFLFADLYRRIVIFCIMLFIQWTYKNKDLFSKRHEGFYICDSQIKVQEFIDSVECDESNGKPYFYTRDVHLGVGKIVNIKAGDKVRVSSYIYEKKNRREDLGIKYYSEARFWSKIK